MKKRRIILTLIEIMGIIISMYIENKLLTIFLGMLFVYTIYIFMRHGKTQKKDNFNLRASYLFDIVIFCVFILMFRLIQIQMIDSQKLKDAVSKQVSFYLKARGDRGSIYDSNGKVLAHNIDMYNLIVNPKTFIRSETAEAALKELVEKKYIKANYKVLSAQLKNLGKENRGYKLLNKYVDEIEKIEIENILRKNSIYRKNIMYLEGRKERKYYKPNQYFFLVGNLGIKKDEEKEGIFGLELFYEDYLKGDNISKVVPSMKSIRNIRNKLPTSKAMTETNIDGNDIYLTIDNDIQYILNDEVEKQFKKIDAEEAYGIIMNPNNGKILATSFFRKDKKNMTNPIFQSILEPGSIFKPIVMAAAIDAGKVNENSHFDVKDGKIKRYDHTIRESSSSVKGILSVKEIIKKSSNVGMVLVGERFLNSEFDKVLSRFGFYKKTGVDYPYEKSSRREDVRRWNGLKKNTMSFGQGIGVTPIQMITGFSSVINGGTLYQPYLVEKIVDKDGLVVMRNLPKVKAKTISKETSEKMKKILEEAVNDGTAHRAKVAGYRIGGKTGTAQYTSRGKYVKQEYLSSVVGFFPVETPEYVILTMFFKPKGKNIYDRFGGVVAAPVLGSIIERIVKLKNIYPENIENIVVKENVEHKSVKINKELLTMPNLIGFSARDVMEIFLKTDIDVELVGTGVVKKQSLAPNTSLLDVKKIRIELD